MFATRNRPRRAALLLAAALALGAAPPEGDAKGPAPRKQGRLPALTDEEAWRRLPRAEQGRGRPLPLWARILADPLPRTTAAMLELDYRHRALSTLDPKLRAEARWAAAHANGCHYAEEVALADLRRAGAGDAEVSALTVTADRPGLREAHRAAVAFARKLTLAGHSVTDDEVKRLREQLGSEKLVALVLLVAHANFQDRLLLTLGLTGEPGGPTPPEPFRFTHPDPPPTVPARKAPGKAPADDAPDADPEWGRVEFDVLQEKMEGQRARAPRIEVPAWDVVKAKLPKDAKQPAKPLRIRWSLVCMGYQPELAAGWSACTRAFGEEAKQDRVFEESLFWVVTRSIDCFY
jgi:alkylhydroperoxidase family enzyme